MARKSYSDTGTRTSERGSPDGHCTCQCIVNRGLVHSSIAILCAKKWASPKPFFYSLFASKEELVMSGPAIPAAPAADAMREQLMKDPTLSWRAGVETFLKNCCYGAKNVGFAVLSIEEEQQVYRCLSEAKISRRSGTGPDCIYIVKLTLQSLVMPVDSIDPRLFGNLASGNDDEFTRPSLTPCPSCFPEVAEDMVDFQVNALLDEMQRSKERIAPRVDARCIRDQSPCPERTYRANRIHPQSTQGTRRILGQPALDLRGLFAPCVQSAPVAVRLQGIFYCSERGGLI